MAAAIDAEEVQRQLDGGDDFSHTTRAINVVYELVLGLLTLRMFDTWQSHITFEIVKLIFWISVPHLHVTRRLLL